MLSSNLPITLYVVFEYNCMNSFIFVVVSNTYRLFISAIYHARLHDNK